MRCNWKLVVSCSLFFLESDSVIYWCPEMNVLVRKPGPEKWKAGIRSGPDPQSLKRRFMVQRERMSNDVQVVACDVV